MASHNRGERTMTSTHKSSWYRTATALVAGAATVAVLGMPGIAAAKKSKKKKKGSGHVQLTGVKSLDKVFKPLKKLDKSVTKAQKARRTGSSSINTALGLKKGTSLNAAMTHLRNEASGKVKVTLSGGAPQLKASDALPPDIKAGIEATNTVIQSYIEATTSLAKVPKQANKLVKQAKALPKQLKSEILSNPTQAISIAKNLGVVKDNIQIAAQIPKRSVRVTKNLNKDLKIMVAAFGGKWPPI
jgi:hypothetical protein